MMERNAKLIHLVRHGQALHNVRAEAKKDDGCSHEDFLETMKEDDVFDAPLTNLGIRQASDAAITAAGRRCAGHIELVVASPLSRALDTAELLFAPPLISPPRRICYEGLREIMGWLQSSQRQTRMELERVYQSWDFSDLQPGKDIAWERWGAQLEPVPETQKRAHDALRWLWARPEHEIAVVGHGGLFRFLTNGHPYVTCGQGVGARFGNCEIRTCRLSLLDLPAAGNDQSNSSLPGCTNNNEGNKAPLHRFLLELFDVHEG